MSVQLADLAGMITHEETGTPEIGFGIYLHWPFCAAKCPYCDFNSHVRHQKIDAKRFLAAMTTEMATLAQLTPRRQVTSVFFGGGTPSLMQPGIVHGLLEAIARHWTLSSDTEITLEANPSSVDKEHFHGYRAAGVNRLSLGVQSLDDTALRFLGRLHNAEEARAAITLARAVFPRLSFDLIYARPGQTLDAWRTELEEAIRLAADHLSLYQLTIEPDTAFAALHESGRLIMPDADLAADFYALTQDITGAAGLPAYEISNHAKPGAECRHNLLYWRYGEYIGIGAGAHGRIARDRGLTRLATAALRHPEEWAALVEKKGHGIVEAEIIRGESAGDEFLLMGLRLKEGINPERYAAIAGRRLDPRRLEDLLSHQMVEVDERGHIRATPSGFAVLDAVVADLAA